MRAIAPALCFSIVCAAAVSAQTQTESRETKSKIAVKGGKEVQITGCVEPTANGYMLTKAADKAGALHSYMLVSDDVDLAKHVGHLVQVTGNAADRGDATVKTETKTKTKIENGDDKEHVSKSEVRGDLTGMPFIGVKSVKMIAGACR
jgi:hypothetical protein